MLYYIGIKLFTLALFLAGPFVRKAGELRRGRALTFSLLAKRLAEVREAKPTADKVYWVHCASLGEFEQGRPLIEAIKSRETAGGRDIIMAVSFFSPSGYEVRKGYEGADVIFYLPSDTPSHARKLVRVLRPDIAIFVKYEYWHNILKSLSAANVQIYLVSSIFREGMSFFRWYGGFFRKMLRRFTWLYVQDEGSRALLSTIGICRNVTVAGDTRFDRVAQIASQAKRLDIVEAFSSGSRVFVCGSTWPSDEALLEDVIRKYKDVKFVVAPHEIEVGRIEAFMRRCGRPAVRYTQTTAADAANAELLMIDCIGILSSVYQYGFGAYIGGGFGRGIHNILEAATWGSGVIFGPRYGNFNEAVRLVDLGGALSISTIDELDVAFSRVMSDGEMGAASAAYVLENSGGTSLILRDILGS